MEAITSSLEAIPLKRVCATRSKSVHFPSVKANRVKVKSYRDRGGETEKELTKRGKHISNKKWNKAQFTS